MLPLKNSATSSRPGSGAVTPLGLSHRGVGIDGDADLAVGLDPVDAGAPLDLAGLRGVEWPEPVGAEHAILVAHVGDEDRLAIGCGGGVVEVAWRVGKGVGVGENGGLALGVDLPDAGDVGGDQVVGGEGDALGSSMPLAKTATLSPSMTLTTASPGVLSEFITVTKSLPSKPRVTDSGRGPTSMVLTGGVCPKVVVARARRRMEFHRGHG